MMTIQEIQEKAAWLDRQLEENCKLFEDAKTEKKCYELLSYDYLVRLKETVLEYKRLAAEYAAYKNRVHSILDAAYYNLVITPEEREN